MSDSKEAALQELERVMKEHSISARNVGVAICNDTSFMMRLRDPSKSVTSTTLDKIGALVKFYDHQKSVD